MEPLTGPIRWGLAGTGNIVTSFATDFPRAGEGEIVAVASRSQASADAFAAEHAIGRAHGSYEALAADPEVDVVYVGGIHPVHCPQTVMFLEAGKHVLVEKPIALNTREVDEMIAAATANDRFLMEAMWMRFNPASVDAVARIHEGAIGEVRRVLADFSFNVPYDPEMRLLDPTKGGGALLDVGIYPFTLAWWILGEPATATAAGHLADTGVDDAISVVCGWENGASAALTAGVRVPGTMTARVEGSEGVVEFPLPAHAPDHFVLKQGFDEETVHHDPPGLHYQAIEVHRCLRAGERESPRMPLGTSRAMTTHFDALRAQLGVVYPAD
ncbi:MAG: Gfo/Idh/MocA family oxidoreductase [Acidimicrobiales bacterium]|nr:Gfo/Idh/MocA family oxidoreductase [Acidimicrobiales bacterium]